jgi:hypothetical protein
MHRNDAESMNVEKLSIVVASACQNTYSENVL